MISDLFNCFLRNVSENNNLGLLAEPQCSANRLLLNKRVPLRLQEINAGCNREVQPDN